MLPLPFCQTENCPWPIASPETPPNRCTQFAAEFSAVFKLELLSPGLFNQVVLIAFGAVNVNNKSLPLLSWLKFKSENTMAAAAGLSITQSSSVNIPVAEQPIICVQLAALAAAFMADWGSAANSEVKKSSTLEGAWILAFAIADATACAANSGAGALPIARPVATFN